MFKTELRLTTHRTPQAARRKTNTLRQRIYRYIFWTGYLAVLLTTFIPIAGELNRIQFGPEAFHIRLDHLLHLLVYFLICIYYLLGLMKGYKLFEINSFKKFIFLVMLLGIVTEVVQLWVPERAFNAFDMISNIAGIAIGSGIIKMVHRQEAIRLRRVES